MRKLLSFVILINSLWGFHYFTKTYGKNDESEYLKKVITTQGGYVMAGTGSQKSWILKVDSTGEVIWYRYLTGIYLDDLIVGGDAGFAGVASLQDTIFFFKLNSNGELLNAHWYLHAENQLNINSVKIHKCTENTFYISGNATMEENFTTYDYYYVILVDTAGNPIKSKLFSIGSSTALDNFASVSNGTNLIMCQTNSSVWGACILEIDSSMNVVWSKRFYNNTNAYGIFYPNSATEFANGFVFAGKRDAGIEYNIALVAIDSSGNPLWFSIYKSSPAGSRDEAIDVSKSSSGLVIAGNGSVGSFIIYLKTDESGNLQWSKKFSDPGGHSVRASAICQTGVGPYLIGGKFDKNAYWDYLLFTVTTDGDFPAACGYFSDINMSDSICPLQSENIPVSSSSFNLLHGEYSLGGFPFEVSTLCGVATSIDENGCNCGYERGNLLLRSLPLERSHFYRVFSNNGRLIYQGHGKTLILPVGIYIVKDLKGESEKVIILK